MVLDDGLALDQTPARLRAVMLPKGGGAWNLHELTTNCPLDHFVMYSSAASLLGSPGQSGYCAGNAFLDALAHARRAAGRCALAINWGPFAEAGAAATAHRGERLANRGVPSLTPDEGLSILGRLLVSDVTQVGALRLDLRQWLEFFPHVGDSPIFAELGQPVRNRASAADVDLLARLRQVSEPERAAHLATHVCDLVAVVLRMDRKTIDPNTPLKDLGIDSLMGLELRNRLEASLGLTLSATLIWTQPDITSLAHYLARALAENSDTKSETAVSGPETARTIPVTKTSAAVTPIEARPSAVTTLRRPPTNRSRDRVSPAEVLDPTDAIAIVGMACRFPGGANSLEDFWELLASGTDAIRRTPTDRWTAHPDEDETSGPAAWGGFLDNVDRFDPEFFGIAPREAKSIDPQHRLLLEVTWEALEDAGIVPTGLRGSQTGVFVGICTGDYQYHVTAAPDRDVYSVTGCAPSFAAGRLSYVLGLQGPSMIVDTACSSSLVALHLAARSLNSGESDTAVVAGVNLILSPHTTAGLALTQTLSADGRCKTFDARANGYVRGEGCGVVIVKRLADARRDDDHIHAIIRGSAMNQDGRSTGLTAPSVGAQSALIQQALDTAGVAPDAIDYIEAHGTGTALGDPIEVAALKAVFAPRKDTRPCVLGTVKTNIGHTEAAAGLAGVIKTVLALKHGIIPRHLHLQQLNPRIGFDDTPFVLPTEARTWAASDRPRIAGVSSFGFSGTNAHVILQEAPKSAPRAESTATRPMHLLTLSGRSTEALAAQCRRLAEHLNDHPEATLLDVCHTAAVARVHHTERLALLAEDTTELTADLRAFAKGQPVAHAIQGAAALTACKVGFVFSGQGAQVARMGHQLYQTHPAFQKIIDRCSDAVADLLARDLREVLADPSDHGLDQTAYLQPALFAVQMGLVTLWQEWGVTPAIVLGHSAGEFAAACTAGVFDLETGARLVAQRGRLMQAAPEGAMLALRADEARVEQLIAQRSFGDSASALSIAAINGREATVVSGTPAAISEMQSAGADAGIGTRALRVNRAFHSALMDVVQVAFAELAQNIDFQSPRIPFVRNIDGAVGDALDAHYWSEQLRAPVRFSRCVTTLGQAGCDAIVEIGPQATLIGLVADQLGDEGCKPSTLVPSLRRQQSDWTTLLRAVGQLHVSGVAINWSTFDAPYSPRKMTLPPYAFTHERYWVDAPHIDTPRAAQASSSSMLGTQLPRLATAPNQKTWAFELSEAHPIVEHRSARSIDLGSFAELMLQAMKAETEYVRFTRSRVRGATGAGINQAQLTLDNGKPQRCRVRLYAGNTPSTFEEVASSDATAATAPPGAVPSIDRIRARTRKMKRIVPSVSANTLGRLTFKELWAGSAEACGTFQCIDPGATFVRKSLINLAGDLYAAWGADGADGRSWRPVVSRRLDCVGKQIQGTVAGWAYLRVNGAKNGVPPDPATTSVDFVVRNTEGRILLKASGMQFGLFEDPSSPGRLGPSDEQRSMMPALPAEPSQDDVERYLIAWLAHTTGARAERIDPRQDWNQLGVDSLMTLELFANVERQLGVRLGTEDFALTDTSVHALAAQLFALLRPDTAGGKQQQGHVTPPDPETSEGRDITVETDQGAHSPYTRVLGNVEGLQTKVIRLPNGPYLEFVFAGHGRTIMLLPPILANAALWKHQICELSKRYRLIIPNYPGYGRSARDFALSSPTALAGHLVKLLPAAGVKGRVDVVGWSLGGMIAQALASDWPDHVRSLSLINTTAYLPVEDTATSAHAMMSLLKKDLEHGLAALSSEERAQCEAMLEASKGRLDPIVDMHYLRLVLKFDGRRQLDQIARPTLIVQGADDELTPPGCGEELAAKIFGSQYHQLAACGHYAPLYEAKTFNALLDDFLREGVTRMDNNDDE
ncbi:MAG: alpha/beta fold hydrolase [Myxococcota bacterium]